MAVVPAGRQPLDVLRAIYLDDTLSAELRLKAAAAAAPYIHEKKAPATVAGVKAQRAADAEVAERGTSWADLLQGSVAQ